jgi:cytochrome P450
MSAIAPQKSPLPLPPGDFGLPVIGETLNFLKEKNYAQKRQAKYGPIFKSHIFGSPTIFLSGATANTFLFANENKYFEAAWPPSTRILLGPASLAVQGGTFHRDRRKLLFQAFQPRALASYIPQMEEITQRYLDKWEKEKKITWYPEVRSYTFDIASTLFVGGDRQTYPDIFHYFEDWNAGLFSIPLNFPWTNFGKALRSREKLLKEIEKIILKRQQTEQLGEDALGLLLQAKDENGQGLELAELKDQILLLLFAGHETLTSAIASFCLLMSQYPDICQKIRAEQEQVNLEFPLTLDSLKSLTYLDQVLKEVLRFLPPIGGGFRKVIADCEFQGYQFPKNWLVQYQIGATHRDRDFYTEPDQFDPERFNPERAEDKQQSFGYVTFGGGLRECLGKEFARLEMKIFASYLIKNYQWDLLPDQNLEILSIPTPRTRDGLKVNFFRRP